MRGIAVSRWFRFAVAFAVTLGLCGAAAAEETGKGQLRGQVRGLEGKPVAGARVWLVGRTAAGPTLRNLLTDREGRYELGSLPPGLYAIRVSMEAYEPKVEQALRLASGQERRVDFLLKPAPKAGTGPGAARKLAAEDWRWVLRTSGLTSRSVLRFLPGKTPVDQRAEALVVVGPVSGPVSGMLSDAATAQFAYRTLTGWSADILMTGGTAALASPGAFVSSRWQSQEGIPAPAISASTGYQTLSPLHPLRAGKGVRFARTYRVGADQLVALPAGFELNYRLDYLRVSLDDGASAVLPVLELRRGLGDSTVVYYAFRSESTAPSSNRALAADNGIAPTVPYVPALTRRDGRVRLKRLTHHEAGLKQRLSPRTQIAASVFHERVTDAALLATPAHTAAPGDDAALPNFAGTALLFNGGSFAAIGAHLSHITQWSPQWETVVSYVYGAGLAPADAPPEGNVGNVSDSLRGSLEARAAHGIGAHVKGTLPVARTRLQIHYQWLSEGLLTRPNDAGHPATQMDPYLAVRLRQPVPSIFFIPPGLTLLADARNLLNQGGSTITLADGTQVQFLPVLRSIRGGLAYRF